MIEVLSNSVLNSVQDMGRTGLMHVGIGRGGAIDPVAASVANWLAGNMTDAAVVEIVQFPFRVVFKESLRFSLAGTVCRAVLDGVDLPGWWTDVANAGQELTVHHPLKGMRAYFGVAGGIDVPAVLGARATDLKSGFGGINGQGLLRGTTLPVAVPDRIDSAPYSFGVAPLVVKKFYEDQARDTVRLRVMAAAEYGDFTASSLQAFSAERWQITQDANRIGYKLAGTTLSRSCPTELLSHGIVAGVVQVPRSGQPIIQLADANTSGGYPKIATVIEADLWKLGQMGPGEWVSFEVVTLEQALDADSNHRLVMKQLENAIFHTRRRHRNVIASH